MTDLVIRGGTRRHRRRRASAPTWRSTDGSIAAIGAGAAGRPRTRSTPRGLHVLPGADRRPRALQRARPHGVGRRGDRQPRAGRRRRHAVLRHAAQLDAVHASTPAEFDRKRAALEAASITDFGLWGGLMPGSVGDMAAHGRSRASSGSRRSCATPACRSFRAPTTSTLLDGHARGGAAGAAGRGACGERRQNRGVAAAPVASDTPVRVPGVAAARRRTRGDRRAPWPLARETGADCTSSMSVPGPALCWRRRRRGR